MQDLVAQVGSNATLAQICLESCVLDTAVPSSPLHLGGNGMCCRRAAGIFDAVAAVLQVELGAGGQRQRQRQTDGRC